MQRGLDENEIQKRRAVTGWNELEAYVYFAKVFKQAKMLIASL